MNNHLTKRVNFPKNSTLQRKSFATLVQPYKDKDTVAPWARALSLNPKYPNVDIVTEEVKFGRRADCQVKLGDNLSISGCHCRLFRADAPEEDRRRGIMKAVYLEDLSTNGTFVQGKKIGKGNVVRLNPGTEFDLIPPGGSREKIGFLFYVHEQESEAPSGSVTFVFTDVQSSTNLWQSDAEAMNDALTLHDETLRALLVKFRGYEVKTEGDAFMVTFYSVLDAIRWCLAAQRALAKAKWPPSILELPSANRVLDQDGKMVFSGLRIRMGIHVGTPICRRNPVTKRMDYYGPVVNMSARVSDTAHGGQIVCTQAIVDALEVERKQAGLPRASEPCPVTPVKAGNPTPTPATPKLTPSQHQKLSYSEVVGSASGSSAVEKKCDQPVKGSLKKPENPPGRNRRDTVETSSSSSSAPSLSSSSASSSSSSIASTIPLTASPNSPMIHTDSSDSPSPSPSSSSVLPPTPLSSARECKMNKAQMRDAFGDDVNDIVLYDHKAHILKGIGHPVRIYQITAPDLASRSFPPLRVEHNDEEPEISLEAVA